MSNNPTDFTPTDFTPVDFTNREQMRALARDIGMEMVGSTTPLVLKLGSNEDRAVFYGALIGALAGAFCAAVGPETASATLDAISDGVFDAEARARRPKLSIVP